MILPPLLWNHFMYSTQIGCWMIRKEETLARSFLSQSVCSSTSIQHLLHVNSSRTSLILPSSNLHTLMLARRFLISNYTFFPLSHPALPSPPSWTPIPESSLPNPSMPSLSLNSPAPIQCKTTLPASRAAAPRSFKPALPELGYENVYHSFTTTGGQAVSWCKLFDA